jgi:hypothetical protein
VLLGGADWAAEFRDDEFRAFALALATLVDQRLQLSDRVMPEEQLTLEYEAGSWWLELQWDPDPDAVSLRFVLAPPAGAGRGVEGCWRGAAVEALVSSVEQLLERQF